MKRAIWIALGTSTVISATAAITTIDAASSNPQQQPLAREEYVAAMAAIDAERPAVVARCDAMPVADREQCRARGEAEEFGRIAELDLLYKRDRESARRAQRARVEARYQAERVKCAALGGNRRDRCFIDAHAQKGRALLETAAPYAVRS